MKVVKESQGGRQTAPGREDLALINALARKELKAEEVYTFSVRLCDNEVDRDGERFAPQTLEELAKLFVGKSGIFDHQWSAQGQAARIYKTEVVREPERATQAGDGYCWLKGYAYMLRTERSKDLIAEIEGGIKKEVSVGCAVERSVCSICGKSPMDGSCGHKRGERYGGALCFASLEGASDAYEFSFVAVPAQPAAGVVKRAGREPACLKELSAVHPGCARELERLEREAELGREYLSGLKAEVARLGMLAGTGLERGTLKSMADKLSLKELLELKRSYEEQAGLRLPLKPQLRYGEETTVRPETDRAFLI